MSAISNNIFICSHCDAQFAKWTGKCLECGQWGTIKESIKKNDAGGFGGQQNKNDKKYAPATTVELKNISATAKARLQTNLSELNNVLGGGLVVGSLTLLGGEPGIGKSTLALQVAALIPGALYFSGEESAEQLKMRAERLNISSPTLKIANCTNVETIIATIKSEKTKLAVIDSIQTIFSDMVEGEAGNINQIKTCTVQLMECAKSSGTAIIIVGQVTKEGAVAGPKTLEHLVDTVLYLEGDRFHDFRLLRSVKNRFGATDEVGVFTMEKEGLKEVINPSAAFLAQRSEIAPGTVVTCLIEGTRPLLVEIQALVTKTIFGYPQRRASGFDLNRLQVLIGVLSKRAGLPLESYDVFLNVVGGLNADEPAADLAVILAVASGIKNKSLPQGLAAFGEVGLAGEVRGVLQTEKRLNEIKNLGFEFAVVPPNIKTKITGLKIASIKNVQEVVEKIVR